MDSFLSQVAHFSILSNRYFVLIHWCFELEPLLNRVSRLSRRNLNCLWLVNFLQFIHFTHQLLIEQDTYLSSKAKSYFHIECDAQRLNSTPALFLDFLLKSITKVFQWRRNYFRELFLACYFDGIKKEC